MRRGLRAFAVLVLLWITVGHAGLRGLAELSRLPREPFPYSDEELDLLLREWQGGL